MRCMAIVPRCDNKISENWMTLDKGRMYYLCYLCYFWNLTDLNRLLIVFLSAKHSLFYFSYSRVFCFLNHWIKLGFIKNCIRPQVWRSEAHCLEWIHLAVVQKLWSIIDSLTLRRKQYAHLLVKLSPYFNDKKP